MLKRQNEIMRNNERGDPAGAVVALESAQRAGLGALFRPVTR